MAQWVIKDFGGEIPRKDPRQLPDQMAEAAWNCDLSSGPLDGLPLPVLVKDLSAVSSAVRRAYRVPGPAAGDPDAWLALPSEYSSVVRGPLANDTLHRVYWTNPPDTSKPGGWWNTYAGLIAGTADYNLGFIAPDPALVITAVPPGEVVSSFTIVAGGSTYTVGSHLTVQGGVMQTGQPPQKFIVSAVDGAGAVTALTIDVTGTYTTRPADPAPLNTIGGHGAGCTVSLAYAAATAPLIARAYTFTYIDVHGEESSPCVPSVVVDGRSAGPWLISGLPTAAPASPTGFNYPTVVKMRLYRTVVGATTAADYFQVADLSFGSATYVDTIADTTVVQALTLVSTSWLPPPADLDGLTGFPGGMMVGFTGNTIHFCEPERPNAWPAGYDQSLHYEIMGFGVWQNSLVVLTQGFPSTGAGTTPANFAFTQVQVPEPCISRGSIVTDLLGVYYASQNGLVMLNYFGMQNQTLSNFTKNIWLTDYHAADLVACRHRAQYLAINGTGTGFLIDYTEPRMGVVRLNTFSNAVCVWNDVYTGATYIIADKKVYLWDSTATDSLIYRWRSKQFYLPQPISLGACQISLETAVENTPPPPSAVLDNGDPLLVLPAGINAVFNLYAGPEGKHLVFTKKLTKPRMLFRLPSGHKVFNWQCEIVGRVAVHSVELATTMKELSGV